MEGWEAYTPQARERWKERRPTGSNLRAQLDGFPLTASISRTSS
jgi:hypothetical protein